MTDTKKDNTDATDVANTAPSTMGIKAIRIKNFRSFEDVELDCSSFNILVGRNNHGKSNFIEALAWFYTGREALEKVKRDGAPDDAHVEVEVTFSNAQAGLNEFPNDNNRKKIVNIIGSEDELRVKRSSDEAQRKRQIFNPSTSTWTQQPCGTDSAFNNCIPRLEFIQTATNLKEVATYKSTSPIGHLLKGLLESVLNKEGSTEFEEFLNHFAATFGHENPKTGGPSAIRDALNKIGKNVKSHLKVQFPDCRDVSFDIPPPEPEDLLKGCQVTLDDGVVTSAADKGDGMQRSLMLAIIKAYAAFRREASGRSFVFFIDEAELHLHPTAQRQLKESLLNLAQNQDQVFITTHSSVFIADKHEDQSIFSVLKEEKITRISQITDTADLQDTIFELLGGHPADLLLPPNFLIVEGPSEVALIKGLIKRFYKNKPNIKIIAATGDDRASKNQLDAIQKILSISDGRAIYGDKIVVLLDKPETSKKQRFETFKEKNPDLVNSGRLFVLPVDTLENYYPSSLVQNCISKPPNSKVLMAQWMAENLLQIQFEDEMPQIFAAVSKCWDLAFAITGRNGSNIS